MNVLFEIINTAIIRSDKKQANINTCTSYLSTGSICIAWDRNITPAIPTARVAS